MPASDPDPRTRRRHDRRTPLTVIHGAAHRLVRLRAQAEGLRREERTRLEDQLAALDAAAADLRERIADLTEAPASEQATRLRATPAALARARTRIVATRTLLRRIERHLERRDDQ